MPEDPPASDAPVTTTSPRFVSRWLLQAAGVVCGVLLLLVLGVFAWRALSVTRLERRITVERDQMAVAKREALRLQARDMLRLAARPLAWAVRGEVTRNNLGQVDDYLRLFVREPGVRALMFVGNDGRVALATDRKLETQDAAGLVSGAIRTATDVVIEESAGFIRMGVPVMGLDNRMGVLVVDYAPPTEAAGSPPPEASQAPGAR